VTLVGRDGRAGRDGQHRARGDLQEALGDASEEDVAEANRVRRAGPSSIVWDGRGRERRGQGTGDGALIRSSAYDGTRRVSRELVDRHDWWGRSTILARGRR
jgi:hypothetical protein